MFVSKKVPQIFNCLDNKWHCSTFRINITWITVFSIFFLNFNFFYIGYYALRFHIHFSNFALEKMGLPSVSGSQGICSWGSQHCSWCYRSMWCWTRVWEKRVSYWLMTFSSWQNHILHVYWCLLLDLVQP